MELSALAQILEQLTDGFLQPVFLHQSLEVWKKMCGLDIEEDDSHDKESGARRLARDESDVQKITAHCSPLP